MMERWIDQTCLKDRFKLVFSGITPLIFDDGQINDQTIRESAMKSSDRFSESCPFVVSDFYFFSDCEGVRRSYVENDEIKYSKEHIDWKFVVEIEYSPERTTYYEIKTAFKKAGKNVGFGLLSPEHGSLFGKFEVE